VLNGTAAYYPIYTGYKKKDINFVSFGMLPIAEPEETTIDTTGRTSLENLPYIIVSDTAGIITNLVVRDVAENEPEVVNDSVLFYTVQVMALHNPVDPSYFKNAKIVVLFNAIDKFYRYTTGRFKTNEEAYAERERLIKTRAYRSDIFVKKVYKK